MTNRRVKILIPYYTNELSELEKYSLERGLKIFADYPISLVSPEGLEISKEYNYVNVERFEAKYFQSLTQYNQLLLSEKFYQRFLSSEYILIYQLDALVFKDELEYWCSLGYDYYGAPWNKTWKKRYYNFYGLLTHSVGNGGFSLRKTEVFYNMTCKIRWIRNYVKFGEDIFWCTYGKLIYPRLKIIDYKMAIRFAFESQPEKLYETNGNNLPFGCHAFEKNNLPFWNKIILDLPQT